MTLRTLNSYEPESGHVSNVIPFTGITKLDLPPDRILESAIGHLDGVVVLGYKKDSGEEYFASSYADGGDMLWLLERAKQALLRDEE